MFKIFLCFWLAQIPPFNFHNQLGITKFGGQGYFRLAIGEGAKHFYKEVSGGQQIDCEIYF